MTDPKYTYSAGDPTDDFEEGQNNHREGFFREKTKEFDNAADFLMHYLCENCTEGWISFLVRNGTCSGIHYDGKILKKFDRKY